MVAVSVTSARAAVIKNPQLRGTSSFCNSKAVLASMQQGGTQYKRAASGQDNPLNPYYSAQLFASQPGLK